MTAGVSALRRLLTQRGTPVWQLAAAATLGLASAAATVALLAGSGYLVGRAALRPGLDALVGLLAAVEVLAFLRGPLRYAERLLGHDAALRSLTQWRLWLFDRLAQRVPAAFASWRSGDLLSRAVDDVDTLTDLSLRVLLPVVVALGTAALGTALVGAILPLAAVALGVPLAVAIAVPSLVLWRANNPDRDSAAASAATATGELTAQIVDVVQGAADLLAFRASEPALARIHELSRRVAEADRREARRGAVASFTISVCQAIAVIATTALAVRAIHLHQLGRVMVAVVPLAVLATFEPVPFLAHAVLRARTVQVAASRLLGLGDVPVPVTDPAAPAVLPPGVPAIAFLNASLRYAPDLPRALDGITFALPPRTRLALTGSSGSGKSSVVNALLRFWPLESGVLEVGGVDVVHLTQHDARALCALADQSAHMFTGTVRSNLALARPDVSEAELQAALDAAQLTEWVAGLPEGLETPVGDDGVAISGGERRRLAVARALIARSPILLLDEPTSALDEPTADRLVAAVLATATSEGRSVVLVTHRTAEAQRCDAVFALEAGVSMT